jgi:hypothetical protein
MSTELKYVSLEEYSKEFFEIWGEEPTFVLKGDKLVVTNQCYVEENNRRNEAIGEWLNENK